MFPWKWMYWKIWSVKPANEMMLVFFSGQYWWSHPYIVLSFGSTERSKLYNWTPPVLALLVLWKFLDNCLDNMAELWWCLRVWLVTPTKHLLAGFPFSEIRMVKLFTASIDVNDIYIYDHIMNAWLISTTAHVSRHTQLQIQYTLRV